MYCKCDSDKILKIVNIIILIVLTIILVIVLINSQIKPNVLVAIAETRR